MRSKNFFKFLTDRLGTRNRGLRFWKYSGEMGLRQAHEHDFYSFIAKFLACLMIFQSGM